MDGRRGVPLDADDAARLWMSTRKSPMVVTAVLALDGPLAYEALLRLVDTRLLAHARLRQRIARPLVGLPRWQGDPRARSEDHVARLALPPGATDGDLARAAGEIATEALSLRHAPWRIWLVDGTAEGSALVVRVHHAVADGLALVGLLLGFSDEGAEAGVAPPPHAAPRAPAGRDASLVARAAALASLVLRRPEAPPGLSGPLSGDKRLAWSAPFDLERVRAASHALGGHVNDVALGALAGALRAHVLASGGRADAPVHALVPVAMPHAPGELGNRYVSVFVALPVHVADPRARALAARDAMQSARDRAGVSLGRSFVGAARALGRGVERAGVRVLSRRASIVASNVAGPSAPIHVGGRRVAWIAFASPAPGSVALSASFMSYAGSLRLTVASDARVVPDPSSMARAFEAELAAACDRLLGGGPSRA